MATRWGKLRDIAGVRRVLDGRVRDRVVQAPSFKALPNRLKHLAAWRRSHMFVGHSQVRSFGNRQGVRPSSNLNLRKKLIFIARREGRKIPIT